MSGTLHSLRLFQAIIVYEELADIEHDVFTSRATPIPTTPMGRSAHGRSINCPPSYPLSRAGHLPVQCLLPPFQPDPRTEGSREAHHDGNFNQILRVRQSTTRRSYDYIEGRYAPGRYNLMTYHNEQLSSLG